ncbi:unnamed protein product [Urochloa humidicola]
MQPSRFKKICVFCGSSPGNKASYQDAAIDLAKELISRGIDLVYGGGSLGLMGLVSHAVHRGGRHVVGIVPRALMATPEVIGETVGEVKAVEDMNQRKAEMIRESDAFVALPGGYGTLEELFQVITWAQLGIHHKPVGLLNIDGYYNSLLAFIDQAVEEGFISASARHIFVQAPSAQELMEKLEGYVLYYDKVASELDWEMRTTMANGDAGDGSGIRVSSDDTDQVLPPCEKALLPPVKESPLTMDKNFLVIGEVQTPQLVPTDETEGRSSHDKCVSRP